MKKVCKQVRNQIVWKQLKIQLKGCYKMEINSKAFAIPILTAILSRCSQNRDSKCFRIYFHSIATLELYLKPVSIPFDP